MSATDVATLFLTTALRINRFTPRLTDIFNVAAGDEGRPITDFTHRLDYGELTEDAKRVLEHLAPIERTLKSVDGRWFLMRIRPYRTLEDRIEGVVITFVDVTERQEAETRWETRQQQLVSELSHRVRNTLAVVQAIVSQSLSASGVAQEVQKTILMRLQAVAKSHDILVRRDWNGAELEVIAREQLEPYVVNPGRIRLEGPSVILPTEAATPFGLLLHELATNATKYGALSRKEGEVRITWEVIETDEGRRLRMVWKESGGPPVPARSKSGFGSFLIEHGLSDAEVTRDFRRDGLVCTVELPLPAGRTSRS
jgi:two-component system CheB/CheR fusion protein